MTNRNRLKTKVPEIILKYNYVAVAKGICNQIGRCAADVLLFIMVIFSCLDIEPSLL